MSMKSSQRRATGVTPLPLTIVHLDKSLSNGVPKSEVSSSENNNNHLETDSDEGHTFEHSPAVWEDTLLNSSRTDDCPQPGTPTYIAKDAHSLTFQWEQSKANSGSIQWIYSVQMQGVDIPSGALTPDGGSARTLVDPEAWEVVYKGKECWTKIKHLRPGRYYAIRIQCHSTSKSNSAFSSIVVFHTTPTVPTIMQPPSLIGLESSSLRLSWREPMEDGGSEISGFRLQLRPPSSSDQEDFWDVYNGLQRNFKVTDLEPFTKYNARVKAINEVGEGPWSLCSCFKTRAAIPAPPRNLTGVFLTPSVTLLEWDPILQRCRNQIVYEVEMQDLKTGLCCYIKTGFETKHEIGEIEAQNEVQFRVRGMNEVGFGDWSPPITVLTNPVPPGPPSCPKLVSSSQSSASFTWDPPLTSGGSPVSLYSAEMMSLEPHEVSLSREDPWRGVYQGHNCACEVKGLIPGCEYRIRLKARNLIGSSLPSLILQFHTRPGIPGICGIPYSLDRTSRSMELQWTSPDHDGGRSIDGYRLEACPISDQKLKDDDLEILPFKEVYKGARNQVKLEDLIPGVVYAVRVQAMNPIGISPWSEIGYESTKAAAPGAPEDLEITQQDSTNSIQLKWSAPVNHGASISTYLVILSKLGNSKTGQKAYHPKEVYRGPLTECVLSSLDLTSSNYQIQLNATNKHGTGPWSRPFCLSSTSAAPGSTLEALIDLTVEDIKSTSVKLSWTTLPNHLNNINKTGVFIVEMKSNCEHSETNWEQFWTGIECHCVIRNLTPKTEYLCRVLNQEKMKTNQISFQTKMDIPSTPQNLKITQITSSSMRVEWDELESLTLWSQNHTSSLLYNIQIKQRNQDSLDSVHRTLSAMNGGLKVADLEPNHEYEIQVAAENEIGRSPWSQPIRTKTKLAPPLPPDDIQTKITNTIESELKLEVCWNSVEVVSDDFHKTQKFNLEIYGLSNASKKSRNSQNLFAKCSVVGKQVNSALFNVERSQKYELRIRSISNSGISGRWSKSIFIDTFGYPLLNEEKSNSKSIVESKRVNLDSQRVQEMDPLGGPQQPRRGRKGQVLIPQKQTSPLKRRKSIWKLLRSYKNPLILLCLFLFVLVVLIYANSAN